MARKKNLQLRQEVLSTAREFFLDKGYESVLMKDIAVECSISPSLLQHYYPKKEDILVGIIYDITFRVVEFASIYTDALIDEEEPHKKLIWFGVYFRFFYSLLVRNNLKLLKLYTEVLFNAQLLNTGLRISSDNVREELRNSQGDLGPYLFSGCMSQLIALYFRDNTLILPVDTIIDIALNIVFDYNELGQEEKDYVFSKIDTTATDDLKDKLWDYYNEGTSNFIIYER